MWKLLVVGQKYLLNTCLYKDIKNYNKPSKCFVIDNNMWCQRIENNLQEKRCFRIKVWHHKCCFGYTHGWWMMVFINDKCDHDNDDHADYANCGDDSNGADGDDTITMMMMMMVVMVMMMMMIVTMKMMVMIMIMMMIIMTTTMMILMVTATFVASPQRIIWWCLLNIVYWQW